MNTFALKIVTPDGEVYDGPAERLACRTIDGDVDVESGFLRRHGEACVRSDDLTDDFAQATYLQGGDVYVLERDQMPTDTGVAALYRY